MRTLSGTLRAAQQGLLVRPAVRVQQRRMSAGEDRYTPLLGPAGPGGTPAVCADSGILSCFTLDGTNLNNKQYVGTPPVGVSPFVVHADSNNLVACAQRGGQVAVVTAKLNDAGQAVNVYISTNGGISFGAPESFALGGGTAGNIQQICCAWNAGGTVLGIFTEGTSVLAVRRTAVNTFSTPVYMLDGFSLGGDGSSVAPGIAAVYSKRAGTGDWVVAASFFATGGVGLYVVAAYLFGDGDLQTASTWSVRQTVLSVLPYNLTTKTPGTTLAVVGMCLTADSLRMTMLENTRTPWSGLNTSRNYIASCQGSTLWKLGAIRDPQALLIDAAAGLRPCYDATNGVLYFVNGSLLYYAARPVTSDYSSRLLHAVKVETEHGTHATLILDNSDGSLTSLGQSQDVPGDQVSLDFGYTTSAGAEYSGTSSAPMWVESATAVLHQGERTLELVCKDAWAMLAAWRPRRLYAWLPGQSTIAQIIQWILARAGLAYVAPGSPSTLLGTSPAFGIKPGENGAIAIHNLLDMAPEVLWFTAAGATLRLPLAGDAAVYSYTDTVHPVISGRLSVHGRGLNHVLVYGNAAQTPPLALPIPSLLAESFDTADTLRVHDLPHIIRDMQVSEANAPARAAVPLRKAQLLPDMGEIATAPNAGLEVWDPIAVTYAGLGLSAAGYRAREIHTTYDPLLDGGVYAQSVGLMSA